MPTTRAARRAAAYVAVREANEQASFLCHLPLEVQASILFWLPLAHDIALAGLTCHSLRDAAKLALKARPFSSEVVRLSAAPDQYRAPFRNSNHGVECAVALPDGRFITGTDDGVIQVWRDGACVQTIEDVAEEIGAAHCELVRGLAALPDGRLLSCSNDDTTKLWTSDGKLERTFEEDGLVGSIAVAPDGVHFVVGLYNGEIKVYHIDGTLLHTFESTDRDEVTGADDRGHHEFVNGVAVTRDGQHIFSVGDHVVNVWSVASQSLVCTCHGHAGEVWAVAAMPDGQRIISGGSDCTVRVWLLDGTPENIFIHHTQVVNALVALPDNQHALSCSGMLRRLPSDNTIKLFNVDTGAVLRTFRHHLGPVNALALLPDGLRFVSGAADDTACVVYHGLAPQ